MFEALSKEAEVETHRATFHVQRLFLLREEIDQQGRPAGFLQCGGNQPSPWAESSTAAPVGEEDHSSAADRQHQVSRDGYRARRDLNRALFQIGLLKTLSGFEMEIDDRRSRLLAQDDNGGSLRRSNGQRRALIDEVLVPSNPAFNVVGKHRNGLLLLADRTGKREIAFGKGDTQRNPDADSEIEQAEQEADDQDDDNRTAPAAASRSVTPPIANTTIDRRSLFQLAGISRTTSRAGLSVRMPMKRGCRNLPSVVHSVKPTSATRSGRTQWAAFSCTSSAKGET
jgi:hypothetical protein